MSVTRIQTTIAPQVKLPLETPLEASKRLHEESVSMANAVLSDLISKLAAVQEEAQAVADLPTIKPGIRELSKHVALDLHTKIQAIEAIRQRK